MKKFTFWILGIDAVLLGSFITGSQAYDMGMNIQPFLIAILVTSINALIGYFIIDKYFHAEFNVFMSRVFGSIFLRLMGITLLLGFIFFFTEIPKFAFTIWMMISYICKSVVEVMFINSRSKEINRK